MNASRSFKLMILSSTISTLIGGTEPSKSEAHALFLPAPTVGIFVGVGFLTFFGRWDRGARWSRIPGVGGVVATFEVGGASGAGGVGNGGGCGMPFGLSEVVESDLCLADVLCGR